MKTLSNPSYFKRALRLCILVVGLCVPIISYAFAGSGEFPFASTRIAAEAGTTSTLGNPNDIRRSVAGAAGAFSAKAFGAGDASQAGFDRLGDNKSGCGLDAPVNTKSLSRDRRKGPCDERTGV